jgi:hypothetical protein
VKSITADVEVPLLVTAAFVPAPTVVTVPTENVALAPESPLIPCGIEKLTTAAEEEPELLTVAFVPAPTVDTVPIAIVAALPVAPVAPVAPVFPCGP